MKKYSENNFDDHIDKLNKRAAKHLVKLGLEKDWKDCYRRMKIRRKKQRK
tara:strand:- start:1206 stop:1355 length:150 start_codon:yes stop_codon:yes gene_type:complete